MTIPAGMLTAFREIWPQTQGCADADWNIAGPVYSGPYSNIYRVNVPGEDQPFAVKFCRSPRSSQPDREFAKRQFGELTYFRAAMTEPSRFKVPQAIALHEAAGILVLGWIEGYSLHDCFGGPTNDDRMVEGMALAGSWLRHFQEAGLSSETRESEESLRPEVDLLISRLTASNAMNASVRDNVSSLIRYTDRLKELRLPTSWLHGDFQPRNILFSGDAVYGLDMAYSKVGFGLKDAAYLLNRFEWSRFTVGGWRSFPYRRVCEEAFINAFLPDCFPEIRFALWWFRMLDHLQFLARHYDDVSGYIKHLHLTTCNRMTTRRSRKRLDEYGRRETIGDAHLAPA